MNWDAIAAIGELVGAAVVAITLIYLAVQTHLNKKAIIASVISNTLNSFSKVHQAAIQSEVVALLYEKGARDPGSLAKGEGIRFFLLLREAMNGYGAMFRAYRNGLIDEATWTGMRFDIFVSQPGVRKFIEGQRQAWDADFVEYIDSLELYTSSDPVAFMTGPMDTDT